MENSSLECSGCKSRISQEPPKQCLKCSIQSLNQYEIQSDQWLHDFSDPPVFRFKHEYAARLNYLQTKAPAHSAEADAHMDKQAAMEVSVAFGVF